MNGKVVMAVENYETVDRTHVERLFADAPTRKVSGLIGVKERTWMFDPERAARIQRVVQLVINEAQERVEEPPYYPVYDLSVVRPIEGDPMVYTARWETFRDDPLVAQCRMMGTFWLMRDSAMVDMQDPEEIFTAYDSRPNRGYNRLMSELHVRKLVPPIFSATGFATLVQSAQREF